MNISEKYSLESKLALVTGGAGLLGVQHARGLVELGAKVYLGDLNYELASTRANEINDEYKNEHVIPIELDVSQKESINEFFEKYCQEKNACVDILVNNAAIDPKVESSGLVNASRFENYTLDNWYKEIDVGLTGAFLCSQKIGSEMAKHKSGIILNIASDLSVIAPDQRLYRIEGLEQQQQSVKPVTYSVIKTALIGLTKYLAAYWANDGIRVNALSPGGVYNNQPDEFVAKLSNLIPMNRMANKDEYIAAVQFLCTDASSYMTGQNIVIDGGRSVL